MAGPLLLGVLAILYAIHFGVVLGFGALARRCVPALAQSYCRKPLLLVASNANIGGPATASALAVGNGWPSLITPALLVGNLGYALATPLGVVLHETFKAVGHGRTLLGVGVGFSA